MIGVGLVGITNISKCENGDLKLWLLELRHRTLRFEHIMQIVLLLVVTKLFAKTQTGLTSLTPTNSNDIPTAEVRLFYTSETFFRWL